MLAVYYPKSSRPARRTAVRSTGIVVSLSCRVCETILAIADYGVESRLCHPCEGRGPGNNRSILDSRPRSGRGQAPRGNDTERCHRERAASPPPDPARGPHPSAIRDTNGEIPTSGRDQIGTRAETRRRREPQISTASFNLSASAPPREVESLLLRQLGSSSRDYLERISHCCEFIVQIPQRAKRWMGLKPMQILSVQDRNKQSVPGLPRDFLRIFTFRCYRDRQQHILPDSPSQGLLLRISYPVFSVKADNNLLGQQEIQR